MNPDFGLEPPNAPQEEALIRAYNQACDQGEAEWEELSPYTRRRFRRFALAIQTAEEERAKDQLEYFGSLAEEEHRRQEAEIERLRAEVAALIAQGPGSQPNATLSFNGVIVRRSA